MALQNTLKALADPIRREILNLLKQGRLSAGEIGEHFPVTAASISRHLSVLKEADLPRPAGGEIHLLPTEHFRAGGSDAVAFTAERRMSYERDAGAP